MRAFLRLYDFLFKGMSKQFMATRKIGKSYTEKLFLIENIIFVAFGS